MKGRKSEKLHDWDSGVTARVGAELVPAGGRGARLQGALTERRTGVPLRAQGPGQVCWCQDRDAEGLRLWEVQQCGQVLWDSGIGLPEGGEHGEASKSWEDQGRSPCRKVGTRSKQEWL